MKSPVHGHLTTDHVPLWVCVQLLIAELWSDAAGLSRADLMETYRLSAHHPVRWERQGRWTAAAGLQNWNGRPLYERRTDWTGLTLRVTTNQVRSGQVRSGQTRGRTGQGRTGEVETGSTNHQSGKSSTLS